MKHNNTIKARVVLNWGHPGHKFFPGNFVRVEYLRDRPTQISKPLRDRSGQLGVIVARSACADGKARSIKRMYTRYFVQFEDGFIGGFHSMYLNKAQ